jgi:3-oxoacyl-[acyl-carrier protein] reductase
MKYNFSGKLVLVTGAGHGLGRAIAVAFADLEADVFALDLNEEGLAETVRDAGKRCRARRLDVTDRVAVQALVEEVEREAGPVSILVNCAGGVRGQVGRPLEAISPADWHAIVDANLSGAFWCSQAVAPAM